MNIKIDDICAIAIKAGRNILEVYESENIKVELKSDYSPLTFADKQSHEIIDAGLKALYPAIPVLSEEGKSIPYEERKSWDLFWLVDPLDGTKEFIKKNGEFTVNIALISNRQPVVGVIYVPVEDTLYYAEKHNGAWKKTGNSSASKITTATPKDGSRVVVSRSHKSDKFENFIKEKNIKISQIVSVGSSFKFCYMAEGKADIYPRLNPTWEWDTAAGHMILEEAGGVLVNKENQPLLYNKEVLLNQDFIAYSSHAQMTVRPKSSNITRHHSIITRKEREELNNHNKGCILWFTGLSGSGKSTVAHAIEEALHIKGCRTFVLDGDNIRFALNKDLGFSKSDRQENIRRIGEVAKLFVEAGSIVLTAFISPFRNDRDIARNLVEKNDFIEIYCNASLEKCKERDIKGLYQKAINGEIKEFTGISSPYEIPETPELILDTGENSLKECVEDMITYLVNKSYIK